MPPKKRQALKINKPVARVPTSTKTSAQTRRDRKKQNDARLERRRLEKEKLEAGERRNEAARLDRIRRGLSLKLPDINPDQGEDPKNPGSISYEVPWGYKIIQSSLRPAKRPVKGDDIFLFTHGASGTITSPSIVNFAEGFASGCASDIPKQPQSRDLSSIMCIQGWPDLDERVAMFPIVEWACNRVFSARSPFWQCAPVFYGGWSMSARAAVMAEHERNDPPDGKWYIEGLVLVSYPLRGEQEEMRQQILYNIQKGVVVLFVLGDKDHLCDLRSLNKVRRRMRARSWLITVQGADHGMNCKDAAKTKDLQSAIGRITAEWARDPTRYTNDSDVGGIDGCKIEMRLPINTNPKLYENMAEPSIGGSKKAVLPGPIGDLLLDKKEGL